MVGQIGSKLLIDAAERRETASRFIKPNQCQIFVYMFNSLSSNQDVDPPSFLYDCMNLTSYAERFGQETRVYYHLPQAARIHNLITRF